MAVQEALWLAKRLSLNLNFNVLNRISLLLISSSYPIVLARLVGPRSRPYRLLQEKCLGYNRESKTGPFGWQSDLLTTIPNRWSQERNWLDFFFYINRWGKTGKLRKILNEETRIVTQPETEPGPAGVIVYNGFRTRLHQRPMISGDGWHTKFFRHLSYSWGKTREKPQPGQLTRPGIEPGPARWETTMLPLYHSGGPVPAGWEAITLPTGKSSGHT